MPPESSLRRAARALISEIQDRVLDLCSLDFPTSSPASLGETYAKMARSIEKGIETTTDERVIQFCVAYLKRVASHLRFIEGASAERIPWALTSPFERLLQKLAPGVLAMVRSRWSYNYTIAELYDSYRTAMKSFLPRTTLTDCFGDDNAKFYLISVPVIERRNVLLHLVLGHEVGHRIAEKYLSSEDQRSVLASINQLVGDGKWYDPNIGTSIVPLALPTKAKLTSEILTIRQSGLKEIISDLCGSYLFGPAYLFALFEVACDEPLDVCPDPHQYYPPWRFRFRECLKVLTARRADELAKYLGSSPPAPAIRESYIERLRYLRTLAVAQPDINAIQDNKIVSRAYVEIQSVLQNLAGFIETELGELAYDLHGERENFPTLIKRLSLGVPPNEGPTGPCDYRSAFTVGWLFRLAQVPIPFDPAESWDQEHDSILCRLVHKAVEYIETAREYESWKRGESAP